MSRCAQFVVLSSSESEGPESSGNEGALTFSRAAASGSHTAKGKRRAVSSSPEHPSKQESCRTASRPPLRAITNTAGSVAAPGPSNGLRGCAVKKLANSDNYSTRESELDEPAKRSKAKRQKRGVERSSGSWASPSVSKALLDKITDPVLTPKSSPDFSWDWLLSLQLKFSETSL